MILRFSNLTFNVLSHVCISSLFKIIHVLYVKASITETNVFQSVFHGIIIPWDAIKCNRNKRSPINLGNNRLKVLSCNISRSI